MLCVTLFIVQYVAIKPMDDKVLTKVKEAEEKIKGGILFPQPHKRSLKRMRLLLLVKERHLGRQKYMLM